MVCNWPVTGSQMLFFFFFVLFFSPLVVRAVLSHFFVDMDTFKTGLIEDHASDARLEHSVNRKCVS